MTTEERFKVAASCGIHTLFSTHKVCAPISSFDLLTSLISLGPQPGVLPGDGPPVRIRLTDLARFRRVLESLETRWNYGKLSLSRDGPENELFVFSVTLGESHSSQSAPTPSIGRKRKRVVDDEADSASGNQEDEDSAQMEVAKPSPSTLTSLSSDMREVYSLLQRGTAKGRLLAEQVSSSLSKYHHFLTFGSSFTL